MENAAPQLDADWTYLSMFLAAHHFVDAECSCYGQKFPAFFGDYPLPIGEAPPRVLLKRDGRLHFFGECASCERRYWASAEWS